MENKTLKIALLCENNIKVFSIPSETNSTNSNNNFNFEKFKQVSCERLRKKENLNPQFYFISEQLSIKEVNSDNCLKEILDLFNSDKQNDKYIFILVNFSKKIKDNIKDHKENKVKDRDNDNKDSKEIKLEALDTNLGIYFCFNKNRINLLLLRDNGNDCTDFVLPKHKEVDLLIQSNNDLGNNINFNLEKAFYFNLGIIYCFYKIDFKQAVFYLKTSLVYDSNFKQAYRIIGLLFLQLKLYQQALDNFLEALKIDNNYIEAHRGVIISLILQEKYNEAKEMYDKVKKKDFIYNIDNNDNKDKININYLDFDEYFCLEGFLLAHNSLYKGAIYSYELLLKKYKFKVSKDILEGLAYLYLSQERYTEAIEVFKRCFTLNTVNTNNNINSSKLSNSYDTLDTIDKTTLSISIENLNELNSNCINTIYKEEYESFTKCFEKRIIYLYKEGQVFLDDKLARISTFLGFANEKLGKLEEALKYYKFVFTNFNNYSITIQDILINSLRVQQLEDAVQLNQMTKNEPNNEFAFYDQGIALDCLGKYEEAINCYRRTLEINPNNEEALFNCGVALEKLGQFEEAAICYQSKLDMDINSNKEENFLAHFNLGNSLFELNKYEEAVLSYQTAIKINPKSYLVYNNLALALSKIGYQDLLGCYEKTIKLNPDNDLGYFNMGNALFDTKQYKQALEFYLKAIEINPENNKYYYNLGNLYDEIGSFNEAIMCYKKSLELKNTIRSNLNNQNSQNNLSNDNESDTNKSNISSGIGTGSSIASYVVYNNLGLIYLKTNQLENAFSSFKSAVKLNCEYEEALNNLLNLGIHYDDINNYEFAIKCYNLIIECFYSNNSATSSSNLIKKSQTLMSNSNDTNIQILESAYFNNGNSYNQIGKYQEAINFYKKAIELNPTNDFIYFNLGFMYESVNSLGEALLSYQKAIDLSNINVEYYYQKANVLFKLEQYEQADEVYNIILKLDKHHYKSLNNIGLIHDKFNRNGEAIKCYLSAIEVNPKYEDAHFNLGFSYGNANKLDESVKSYNIVLSINPNNDKALNNLGDVYKKQGNFQNAVECYKKLLEKDPKNESLLFNLGNTYDELNNYAEAISTFKKSLEINPNNDNTYTNLGYIFGRLNNFDEAIHSYNKALEINPDNTAANHNLHVVTHKKHVLKMKKT